ncbi:rRNA maturation RNase YbeY [uncultured Roseobacter sp.]|uniref:rRNA maturation RNase YbeY n=1 Tax=uncultured Roseobacter sp. TaxID=114847 RepID=UPI0026242A47|nr:rRNA maturation RNase YbeY [uncultured Roseobacter sp.]
MPDVLTEDPRWDAFGLAALAERVVPLTLEHVGVSPDAQVSLMGCDDARIAALNADFRDKPGPTNVLSWPAADLASETPGGAPYPPEPEFDGTVELGDIAIAWETCAREAEAAGKPMADHVCHLIVHGLLHLLGYDHIRDPDATLMEGLESHILGKMGLDDPYRN